MYSTLTRVLFCFFVPVIYTEIAKAETGFLVDWGIYLHKDSFYHTFSIYQAHIWFLNGIISVFVLSFLHVIALTKLC